MLKLICPNKGDVEMTHNNLYNIYGPLTSLWHTQLYPPLFFAIKNKTINLISKKTVIGKY